MRVHEIIGEGTTANIGAATSIATVAGAVGLDPKAPWLQKLVAYAPGTISLLTNIAEGKGIVAALDALEVSLGNAKLLPAELKSAVNAFSALRSAHGLVKGVASEIPTGLSTASSLAVGAAPLVALAGATQQAATADMNKPGANMFASTARGGKAFGDWSNRVSGRDDKYAQMRAAQRAELQAK